MKTVPKVHFKGDVQNYTHTSITHPGKTSLLSHRSSRKSLNKSMAALVLILMTISFYAGTQLTSTQESRVVQPSNRETLEHFHHLNDKALSKLHFKDINFDDYLSRLNEKEYSSYSRYLAEVSYVKDLFDHDMDFNRKVFNAKHDILGADRVLYISFNDQQRRLRADFREQLDLHRENFKKYLHTVNKINRVVKNH
jgi:hypothetical protein